MPLDPLITIFLMLLLWAAGIGYILFMAMREARREQERSAQGHPRKRVLTTSGRRRARNHIDL